MDKEELKTRTKKFALGVIELTQSLPQNQTARTIGHQLLRAATSVGANYRSACQGKSMADFIAKLGIVAEEADECQYWMELLVEGRICQSQHVSKLMIEAKAITAIVVASRKTARSSMKRTISGGGQIEN